jgi:hypothetical protein
VQNMTTVPDSLKRTEAARVLGNGGGARYVVLAADECQHFGSKLDRCAELFGSGKLAQTCKLCACADAPNSYLTSQRSKTYNNEAICH